MATNRTTDNFGIPVGSDVHSLTLGADGPTLLQDYYLVEKLAQFDRERVPERVVHAKGGGAFGTFTVTGDVSKYTKAKVFQPGAETEMLARFSTVAGEQGSPDTWRDPRGFALKFYTEEGNLDIVGNNTPIFFIRDAIQFPDFIHSQKRSSQTGLRDHNMQWDFWVNEPASAHQVTYLMGDRGIPRSWREMNGYASHTFQWINEAGERFWVKYHFHSDQKQEFIDKYGHEGFSADDADEMAGIDADFHRRDLFEAIKEGNFPTWTLSVQVIPYEEGFTYGTNIFDVTKTVSHKDYPLIEVGKMELNRNPEDFFAQIEQAAFNPASLVPGTGLSPDKMLMGRLFSYPDTHRHRIGPNYAQLPVNRPKSPKHNYSRDGQMRYELYPADQPEYAPNSYDGPHADESAATDVNLVDVPQSDVVRAAQTLRENDGDFNQAGELVRNVLDDAARDRLVHNISGHVMGVWDKELLPKVFQYWKNVDEELGNRIETVVTEAKKKQEQA
ncbi:MULTISPECIES: catalase [unclassified Brevibacterium]|uniref:catalase n=1 Tax=unclassified Brevibacterium TaxID=2614124 RepID=UPI0008A51A24|nr:MULTISPECIES: catalase [unclassified Brevibacterium]OFL64877.1 catalase [Brevibacterium sp. HMSC063G07]OFS26620.1 catalase [Brevibacterium sp. HMSC07C04]